MKNRILSICMAVILLPVMLCIPALAEESVPDPIVIKADENLNSVSAASNCKKTLESEGETTYLSLKSSGRTGDPYVTISMTKYYKKASIDKIDADGIQYILVKARAVAGIEGDDMQMYYGCKGGGISELHSVHTTGGFGNIWEYYVFNMANASDFTNTLTELRYDFINLMDKNGEFQISEIVLCYNLAQVYKLCGLDENGRKIAETEAETENETLPETVAETEDQTTAEELTTVFEEASTAGEKPSDGCKSTVGSAVCLIPIALPFAIRRKEDANE